LRETAIVESINLLAAIKFIQKNFEEAKRIIKTIPIINWGRTGKLNHKS